MTQPHVPALVGRPPGGDHAMALAWREERRAARADSVGLDPEPLALPAAAVALVTDGTGPSLRDQLTVEGVELVGLLGPEPLESLAWGSDYGAQRAYLDLPALVADQVEVVVVDLPGREGLRVAGMLVDAGLSVVLARAEPAPTSVLRELRERAEQAAVEVGVVVPNRASPAVAVLAGEVGAVAPLRQLTVAGWPLGAVNRLDLVDLVRRVAGDVAAVCAAPAAMPARELGPSLPVTLALLTTDAVTVLVSELPGRNVGTALVTASGAGGRLALQGEQVRRQDTRGVASVPLTEAPGFPVGRLAQLLAFGDRGSAASLADLLAASRVLDVARATFETGGWLET